LRGSVVCVLIFRLELWFLYYYQHIPAPTIMFFVFDNNPDPSARCSAAVESTSPKCLPIPRLARAVAPLLDPGEAPLSRPEPVRCLPPLRPRAGARPPYGDESCVLSTEAWLRILQQCGWLQLVPSSRDTFAAWWIRVRKLVVKARHRAPLCRVLCGISGSTETRVFSVISLPLCRKS
jgi:hypothetical protein